LLFASSQPLSFGKLKEVIETKMPVTTQKLRFILETLQEECMVQQRAYRLHETEDGYSFKTCEEFSPFLNELFRNRRGEKLTQPSLEVLAIIAYRQPITRPEIEAIRGVDCSGTLQNLQERNLIEPKGRMEAPGRPTLYGTTDIFLNYFGLKSLKELPNLL
jgi:segregation and condensation protein B